MHNAQPWPDTTIFIAAGLDLPKMRQRLVTHNTGVLDLQSKGLPMTTFDWAGLAYYTSYIYRHEDQYAAAAYIRERIEAAFVPVEQRDKAEALLFQRTNEYIIATARAEAAEAENMQFRAELQFIIDATEDDCETAWIASVARLALGGEHE